MAGFTDKAGLWWRVRLDAAAVARVRGATGVDLTPDVALQGLGRAIEALGPATFVDALYAACRPAADARGMSRGQFGRALHGDAVDGAADAFVAAVIDTLPPAARPPCRAAWAKIRVADIPKRC